MYVIIKHNNICVGVNVGNSYDRLATILAYIH